MKHGFVSILPLVRALVLALVFTAGCGEDAPPTTTADLLIHGGTIYTLVDDQPSPVQALAISGGEILVSGSLADAESTADEHTERIDLAGAVALPGLVDAHAHLANLGLFLSRVDLRGTSSAIDCVQRARVLEADLADGEWLLGRGWDQNDWADQHFPTHAILDVAFGDRPVVLERVDGHAIWVNLAALRAAGIDRNTPNPPGGEIVRDPQTGEPTGVLVDNAEDLVTHVEPKRDVRAWMEVYRRANAEALSQGLSCVHDMGVDLDQLEALQNLERAGELDLRVVAYLGGEEVLDAYTGGRSGLSPHDMLRVEGVKLYADGALGSRGAALLEDYSDRPGHRGLLVNSPEVLRRASAKAFERGLGVAIHAIGDRGNRLALDALAAAAADARAADPQLPPLSRLHARIEHAQVLAPADIPRFGELGVIASMQPTHCTSDMPWAPSRLGAERIAGAYAWRSLRELGCILPLGSDFPVEEVAPSLGIFAAITRRAVGSAPNSAWNLAEALTPLESVLGFTVWPSQVLDIGARGRLGVGDVADISILEADPFGDVDRFVGCRVLGTIVDGQLRYSTELRDSSVR